MHAATIADASHRLAVDGAVYLWVPLAELNVDHAYQRAVSETKVKTLAKHFDIDHVGVLYCNMRQDGTMWVIDGQHRRQAALSVGDITTLPAIVYEGLTTEQEARLRLSFHDRKPDTALDVFRLRLGMLDPVALRIKDIVHRVGYTISETRKGAKNTVACVGVLQTIEREKGMVVLARVLTVAKKAWPDDALGHSGIILGGLSAFFGRYPEVDMHRLISVLGAVTPDAIGKQARIRQRDALETGWIRTHVAHVIREVYNKGLRLSNKLAEW